jgi:hypothetical protein
MPGCGHLLDSLYQLERQFHSHESARQLRWFAVDPILRTCIHAREGKGRDAADTSYIGMWRLKEINSWRSLQAAKAKPKLEVLTRI